MSHADDIGYLFKTIITPDLIRGSAEDLAIRRVTKLWTNFAKYGTPNAPQTDPLILVEWKPITNDSFHFLDIGKELSAGTNPKAERMKFWDKIFSDFPAASKLWKLTDCCQRWCIFICKMISWICCFHFLLFLQTQFTFPDASVSSPTAKPKFAEYSTHYKPTQIMISNKNS